MCGLVGVASSSALSDRAWLVRGREAMHHRGPDDAGEWWSGDGRVGLAHRRLSIIDLSIGGHQPMVDVGRRLAIVFNGEIYNHAELRAELAALGEIFCSSSDTEVILVAYRRWGGDCVKRLNGMFAFAIYDEGDRSVFMARDRAGEKPLFFRYAQGELRFASELKALLADSALRPEVNRESLDCFLLTGYVSGDRCMLKGFHKLPAAHALRFSLDSGEFKVWRYWSLPKYDAITANSMAEGAQLEELEQLLEQAVANQLVADVPVGILLSGGIDSGLVTAFAARANPKVKTFTVRFPGFGKYDETNHARLLARQFGTEHIELEASDISPDILLRLAKQYDEPMVDSSMIPTYLVSRLVRQHCKVALGGDGGDELFGGYGYYRKLLRLEPKIRVIPLMARRLLPALLPRLLPPGFGGSNIRSWLMAVGTDFTRSVPLIALCFDERARQQLLASRPDWTFVAEKIFEANVQPGADLIERATRTDFGNYLVEDILVKVDRASMLNSLEIRAPFLDTRLIEFAFSKVPSSMKVTPDSGKLLLQRLGQKLFTSKFDSGRKQGFSIPLSAWLKQEKWLDFFKSILLDSSQTSFERPYVRKLLDGQVAGRANEERMFGLVMFELWRREYGASLI